MKKVKMEGKGRVKGWRGRIVVKGEEKRTWERREERKKR